MALSCNYNCTDLPAHEKVTCGDFPKGGINSVGILECDHSITDFTSEAQFNAAIAAGELKLAEQVRASLPEASEVNGVNPNACGAQDILDGFDWTFNMTDYNVTANNDCFYESLNLRTAYLVLYECMNERIKVIEHPVSFSVKPVIPESNKEKQSYVVVAKWSTNPDEFPVSYAAPTNIFNQ